jgi:DNA excision repair protein ERCC-4
MNVYQYSCDYCSHSVETSGPWPYYGKNIGRLCREDYMNKISEPIYGLLAEIYCPVCDKEKKYIIVEYETPLNAIDAIWLQGIPGKARMTCYKCKSPVFLVLPEGSVKCPRCKKGMFEHAIPLELEGEYIEYPIAAPKGPLRIRQNGKSIAVPKPTVIIDSAEHMGYTFGRFTNWFSGTIRKRLPAGDYTLLGMEKEIAVERKTLPDLVNSIIQERGNFISRCEKLSSFKKKCFVIEGTLSSLKTPYAESQAHPNAVLGSIIAAQERWDIPVHFLDNFLLAEEFVASMLSKYHAYRWLEANGYKRCLIEGDI